MRKIFDFEAIQNIIHVIQRTQPTTPRTKRVHSNSNRKNTFSDYEFSIFTPVLNFFHAHRVSAKELRSKSLNLFAIRHECRTEIRSARLAEESFSNPNRHSEPLGEESRTLPINRHLEPLKNLMQGLLEIFRYRSI